VTSRSFALPFALAAAVMAQSTAAFAAPKSKKPAPPPPAPVAVTEPTPPPVPFPGANDKRRIVGILDVRIDGAPPEVGAQFQKDLDAQIDSKHYFLAPRARIHEIMSNSTRWTEGCVVGPCLRELRSQTNAAIVLLASLTGTGTSFGWVITLVRTDSGNVLSQRAERCDVCTVDEALHNATRAAVDLLSAIPDTLPDESPKVAASIARAPLDDAQVATLHHHRKVTGTALLISGLAIAAAGAALYYAESHASYGLATAGIGAGFVLGGVVTLAF
jgi:hypothetical protein